MSLVSDRLDFDSSSTPSPDVLSKKLSSRLYKKCDYHDGQYCCSKICTLNVLLISTTLIAIAITGMALYMDNWAGISTNPNATLDLPYPKLGPKYLDYVIFNKTIPNDNGTLYHYIDQATTSVRFTKSRFGLLSNCKSAVTGPRIRLFETPWKAPVCKAARDEYQCPIVAMRVTRDSDPHAPVQMSARPMHGCIKLTRVCDGYIDCPSGHDEMNCPPSSTARDCGPDMIQCSAEKQICIPKSNVCDGINDCGMYEDEQNCCGRVGFLRCADGSCVMGERCDAKADCFDLSDEYECPDPSSEFFSKCLDGQLIESTYVCERKEYASFQCRDFSDETWCSYDDTHVKPLSNNPALLSLKYDKMAQCFKQSFTFKELNESMLNVNYQDEMQRDFARNYEFSILRLIIVISVGVSIFLSVVAMIVLLCFGLLTKRCRSIRASFVGVAVVYSICLAQTLVTGIFWLKYVEKMNELLENPAASNIYDKVDIETIKVTGGLASIRLSTHLTFYNSGFYALALLLAIISAELVKRASCHCRGNRHYKGKYTPATYMDDHLATNQLLYGNSSKENSDNGTATPDQIVSPQKSFHSMNRQLLHAASDTALRSTCNGNTYISYKDVDSIDRSDKYITRTLDRMSVVRHTQV